MAVRIILCLIIATNVAADMYLHNPRYVLLVLEMAFGKWRSWTRLYLMFGSVDIRDKVLDGTNDLL